MSAPFGPSPKLREYLDWARVEAECTIKEGLSGTKSLIRIDSPTGGYAFLAGMSDKEPLSHSVVANLDRRLGVDTPFPKTPAPYRD